MEIIVGKNAGFCYGVKRAVEGAKEELRKSNGNMCCLGEIVHNKSPRYGVCIDKDYKKCSSHAILGIMRIKGVN